MKISNGPYKNTDKTEKDNKKKGNCKTFCITRKRNEGNTVFVIDRSTYKKIKSMIS